MYIPREQPALHDQLALPSRSFSPVVTGVSPVVTGVSPVVTGVSPVKVGALRPLILTAGACTIVLSRQWELWGTSCSRVAGQAVVGLPKRTANSCYLSVPAGPVSLAGFLYLDKIIAEFHGIPAAIHDVFIEFVCWLCGVTSRQM